MLSGPGGYKVTKSAPVLCFACQLSRQAWWVADAELYPLADGYVIKTRVSLRRCFAPIVFKMGDVEMKITSACVKWFLLVYQPAHSVWLSVVKPGDAEWNPGLALWCRGANYSTWPFELRLMSDTHDAFRLLQSSKRVLDSTKFQLCNDVRLCACVCVGKVPFPPPDPSPSLRQSRFSDWQGETERTMWPVVTSCVCVCVRTCMFKQCICMRA